MTEDWTSHRETYNNLAEDASLPELDTVITAFTLSPEDIDPAENRLLPSLVDAVVQHVLSLAQDMQNYLTGRTLLYQATDQSLSEDDQDRLQDVYIDLAEEAWNARAVMYKDHDKQAEWLNRFMTDWEDTYREEVVWFCEYIATQWSNVEDQETVSAAENPLFG